MRNPYVRCISAQIFVIHVAGKMHFLQQLIIFSAQVNANLENSSVARSKEEVDSLITLRELATNISEEVWWLFAFLTAKDDHTVEACVSEQIVTVS